MPNGNDPNDPNNNPAPPTPAPARPKPAVAAAPGKPVEANDPVAAKEEDVVAPPTPFTPNPERELYAKDPEAYEKLKREQVVVPRLTDEEVAALNGPGTHTTEAVPGVRASDEERAKEEDKQAKEQDKAEKK